MTDAERIARYGMHLTELHTESGLMYCQLKEEQHPNGAWMKADDVLATIRAQAAQIEALTAENGELQDAREHGWQDRALTSEAERDQLRQWLAEMVAELKAEPGDEDMARRFNDWASRLSALLTGEGR